MANKGRNRQGRDSLVGNLGNLESRETDPNKLLRPFFITHACNPMECKWKMARN